MQKLALILAALSAVVVPLGCGSDDTGKTSHSNDAGVDGAAGSAGHSGTGGSGGKSTGGSKATGGATATGGQSTYEDASTGVICGGVACTLPIGGGIERIKACCTDAGGCGLKLPNVDKCLPRDMPGVRGGAQCPAPTFKTPGGDTLANCCGENGCGALDPFLGCIPNPEIGAPAKACVYDPTNDCTNLTAISCDGAEDCPSGQLCCAKLQGGTTYVQTGCFDSCAALADGGVNFRWIELCHGGETCETAGYSCLGSTILPAPLARCDAVGGVPLSTTAGKAANSVNCGISVCGAGEQCCVRSPHAPYCAKAGESCECHPSDGGSGTHPGPDASSSPDAARLSKDATAD